MASILKGTSRKKSIIAALAAAAIFTVNATAAFAAPFGYSEGGSVRERALNDFLFGDSVILAMNTESVDTVQAAPAEKAATEEVVEETVNEEIPFNTVKRSNDSLKKGETVIVQEGVAGTVANTYKVCYVDGEEVSRELVSSVTVAQPVSKIVEYGNKEDKPVPAQVTASSTGAPTTYKYIIECEATAYSHEECGGPGAITASGLPLEVGMIAVDPRYIPLGSRVYVEGTDGSWSYGYALAADTGGAIKGHRVDLSMASGAECFRFGRKACRVYVIE